MSASGSDKDRQQAACSDFCFLFVGSFDGLVLFGFVLASACTLFMYWDDFSRKRESEA